jgi:hypothetical protein
MAWYGEPPDEPRAEQDGLGSTAVASRPSERATTAFADGWVFTNGGTYYGKTPSE